MDIRQSTDEIKVALFETEWGWMGLLGSAAGLKMVVLPCDSPRDVIATICCANYRYMNRDDDYALSLVEKLKAYFKGEKVAFDEKIDLSDATLFRSRVWQAAQTIPYGWTRSYAWLAEQVGIRSARAVGQALSKNPLPLLVPCHRVIGSGGELVGFAGGLNVKRRLLDLENSRNTV